MVMAKRVGLIVLGLLVVGLVLWWVPKIEVFGWKQQFGLREIDPAFYKRDVFTQEDRARQTLATIVGGLAILAGAYMTWQNFQLSRRIADQSAETAKKNIEIAEDKQITDRFAAAVINLSADDKMSQRLGGIYALERITRDSPKDHWTVMEVLTAYIRDNRSRDKPRNVRKLPTDINEILRVILRRDAELDRDQKQNEDRSLDIYNVDLVGAYLVKAKLKGATMGGTSLEQALLTQADLRNAHLERADLAGAHLMGANLSEANLRRANMWSTNLEGAHLVGARLGGARMADCFYLTQEQLNSANQEEAPASLPPGLTFPRYVDPDTQPTPPA